MTHKHRILTLLILATGTPFSQDYKLTDFVETKLPKVSSDEWFELNHSRHQFKVTTDNGVLKISKAVEDKDAILESENGRIIGTDHGEWGWKN